MTRHISQPWTEFLHAGLAFSDFSSSISTPDKIYKNSWQQTCCSYMFFSLHSFSSCSVLNELLIDLRKRVRTENLKFSRDWDQVMDSCLETQKMINFKAKKSLHGKSKFVQTAYGPVNAIGFYMAFKHCISFATNLAANFDCDRFRIMPEIVSKLLRTAICIR